MYPTPYDIPHEEWCDNCCFAGTSLCNGIACYTGIKNKLDAAKEGAPCALGNA